MRKLVVLKYDWADTDLDFGLEGGKTFLSESNTSQYPSIVKHFGDFDAFLLPSMGRKIVGTELNQHFTHGATDFLYLPDQYVVKVMILYLFFRMWEKILRVFL